MFLMASEYRRLLKLYRSEDCPSVRKKHKALAQNTVVPKMIEMIDCIRRHYGEDEADTLKLILEKSVSEH